jgi:hypothetical protein
MDIKTSSKMEEKLNLKTKTDSAKEFAKKQNSMLDVTQINAVIVLNLASNV